MSYCAGYADCPKPNNPKSLHELGCSNVLVVTATRGDDEVGGACGGTYSGTSFAIAHATGAVALLKARHPTWGLPR